MTKPQARSVADGRVGHRLRIAQAFCLLISVGGIALLPVAIATQWTALNDVCHPISSCVQYQLDAASARTLSEHGISVVDYAIFTATVLVVSSLVWYALAALIIWRKPDDRGALVAAFFLVLFPQFSLGFFTGSPGIVVGFLALILFGFLFPDGRFEPRWARWLAAFAVVSAASLAIPAIGNSGLFFLWVIPIFLVPIAVVVVQIHRFRRVSSWSERQRTKWAFLGLVGGVVGLIAIFMGSIFAQAGNSQSTGMDAGGLYGAFATSGVSVVPLVIPISITIALLRRGLWDVDRVISRALAYAALTLVLAGIYVGGIIGFQALFGLVIGNSSAPAIALSTLAIAALFGPLRRRIQVNIDRRFYRAKYDAARTVDHFRERLRDEVDLARLSEDLTAVVRETLHPEQVSLWLREANR